MHGGGYGCYTHHEDCVSSATADDHWCVRRNGVFQRSVWRRRENRTGKLARRTTDDGHGVFLRGNPLWNLTRDEGFTHTHTHRWHRPRGQPLRARHNQFGCVSICVCKFTARGACKTVGESHSNRARDVAPMQRWEQPHERDPFCTRTCSHTRHRLDTLGGTMRTAKRTHVNML